MEKLQELYLESKITLSELSRKTGISTSTIHRYVKGNIKDINPVYYDPIFNALKSLHPKEEKSDVNSNNSQHENGLNDNQTIEIDVNGLKDQMSKNGIIGTNRNTNIASQKQIRRGEIWYIKNTGATGSEMFGSRPAIVLSSDKLNQIMNTVEIMYITGSPKQELPTHCTITTERNLSVVLGEQISTVSKTRVSTYMGKVTDSELSIIERVALTSLGIKINSIDIKHSTDYILLQSENKMLKEFNEKLLSIAMK